MLALLRLDAWLTFEVLIRQYYGEAKIFVILYTHEKMRGGVVCNLGEGLHEFSLNLIINRVFFLKPSLESIFVVIVVRVARHQSELKKHLMGRVGA